MNHRSPKKNRMTAKLKGSERGSKGAGDSDEERLSSSEKGSKGWSSDEEGRSGKEKGSRGLGDSDEAGLSGSDNASEGGGSRKKRKYRRPGWRLTTHGEHSSDGEGSDDSSSPADESRKCPNPKNAVDNI